MICSREEFLLLLQKWKASKQRVVLHLALGTGPISESLSIRISGKVEIVDPEDRVFIIIPDNGSFPDGDYITIGLDGWFFNVEMQDIFKAPFAEGADEIVTLAGPHKGGLAIYSLKV